MKCPVLNKNENNESRESQAEDNTKSKNSEYLPSDALNVDPIENALKRRQMLDESDTDDDSLDEHGWRITKEMMDRMDNSSWLRQELSDGGLRQMIAEIDNADWENKKEYSHKKRRRINQPEFLSPRETALERAKYTNEKFAKFLDKLMLTAGVLVEKEPLISEVNIAALLTGEIDSNNLSLVAVPSKKRPTELKINDNSQSSSDSEESSDEGSDSSEEE